MTIIAFPTQGEVLQFAFDAFGVLPQKHQLDEHFNETRKKSTQTALSRLANEEGKLDENLGQLLTTFSYLIAGVLPPREALAFGDVFLDLFEIYRDALRTEGTYLTKSETVNRLMRDRMAQRLAISLAKQLQRYNIASDALTLPAQAYWYLPNRPLKKCSSNAPGSRISKKRVAQTSLRNECEGHFGLFAGRFARFGRTYPMAHA